MMENGGEADGKRVLSPPPRTSAKEYPPRHIPGRILDSASGLLRDSLSPTSTQHANILAQVLASEGKAGPSFSSSSSRGTDSGLQSADAARGLQSLPSAKNAFREPALTNGSIHMRSRDVIEGMSLDQFMHSTQHESEVPTWQHSPTAKGKQTAASADQYHTDLQQSEGEISAVWDSLARNEQDQAFPASSQAPELGTNEVQRTAIVNAADGRDVVKLLQDPNFSLGMDLPEQQDIIYTISEEDMKIAAEIVRRIDVAMISKLGCQSAISAASHGEPFPRFSSFFDEVENYQDEVWGYLRPLVEEAKQETAAAGLSEGEEGPATRRLRMILAHIDQGR
jgi:hypothetical protein